MNKERIERIMVVGLDPGLLADGPSTEEVRALCSLALKGLDGYCEDCRRDVAPTAEGAKP